jgi:signal transduction histidine kinase
MSLRTTLLTLIAAVLVPVLLVQGLIYYSRFETRKTEEYRANLEVAHAVAAAFEAYTRDILHQQRTVGQAIAVPPGRLSVEEMQQLLAASAQEYPAIRFYSWLDPEGRVVSSSDSNLVDVEAGDREYFGEIAGGRPWVVSDLMVGRVSGEATFVVARGVLDADGGLLGVVVASIDPQGLGYALAIPRTTGGAIALIDRQGRGVYRFPEVSLTWEERNWVATQPIIAEALAGQEVTGDFVSVIDGQMRMSGMVPIRSLGWVASANRPVDQAMAQIVADSQRDFGLLLLVIIMSAALAMWISRRLVRSTERLRQHALAVGQGEWGTVASIDGATELRDVAGALNTMSTELRQRDEQREEVVSSIAHDLRNPLAVITGHTQLAQRQLLRGESLNEDRLQALLASIQGSAGRLQALIGEFQDAARLRAGPLELRTGPTDLVALVGKAVQELAQTTEKHRFAYEPTESHLVGNWDVARLERVVANLLSNAVKFSPAGGEIAVAVARDDRGAVLTVRDRGIGIPTDDLPHIFNPFRRGSNASGRITGTGLGLWGARRIVEQHGGAIEVASAEGSGSTFTVRLPLGSTDEATDRPAGQRAVQVT